VYTEAIASRTQAEIDELFAGSDACTIGIRSFAQAEADPHNTARDLFYRDDAGVRHPAPAPRFADLGGAAWAGGQQTAAEDAVTDAAAAPAAVRGGGEPYVQPGAAPRVGADTDEVLASAGLSADEITALRETGAVV
jgi:alpha-methylacyl-CoA racemase